MGHSLTDFLRGAGCHALTFGLAVLAMWLAPPVQAQSVEFWAGREVAFKSLPPYLKADNRPTSASNGGLRYRVESVDRDRILISSDGQSRWVRPDEILPIDRAPAFFSGGIARDPRNPRAYL